VSDYLAVGGVSGVLLYLLANAVDAPPLGIQAGSTPGITAISPDLISTGAPEQPQVNLFLYYLSVNPALRNLDLPSFNGQGGRVSNPSLPLDLHYLISAYGRDQFDAEILLAWAMKVFHDTPVVPGPTIQSALDALSQLSSPQAQLIGNNTTLAQQVEQIRITPEVLTTEEIYRLWTAFQAPYRPSTALQVSVVIIQDTAPFTSNLPVQNQPTSRTVTAMPLQGPVIAGLTPAMVPAGGQLTITGTNFLGADPADTVVTFDAGAGLGVVTPTTVRSGTIQVTLPTTMVAGTRLLKVQRTITFPPSTASHPFSSAAAPFQLVPTIQAQTLAAQPNAPVTLPLSPAVGRTQQVSVYIGDQAIPIAQRPASDPVSAPAITFTVPSDVAPGTYPLRIEIDGAQSLLDTTGGAPFTPNLVVA
jgi:Pvc16 N-terminal domain/IPT/TIG domain